jgi:DcuC family C4-dicarboxylate transporter
MEVLTLAAGLAIVVLAVAAILQRVDVRLALLAAGLALGLLAGRPGAILRTFVSTFADERYLLPLCSAMGFAYVMRHAGCDKHLVRLLVRPLRHVRPLLVPGAVVVGFVVNVPVVSQSSTAVTVGTVLIPVLLAARVSPVTAGAALLLGSSVGGELLNPGAPELGTVVVGTARAYQAAGQAPPPLTSADCVERILPLDLVQLAVATLVFWAVSALAERKTTSEPPAGVEAEPDFRVNLVKALVPLVPLAFLFLTSPATGVIPVKSEWLAEEAVSAQRFGARLVALAMLVGVGAALVAAPRSARGAAAAFFDGAGLALAQIVSLIVAAACFGEGIKLLGLASLLEGALGGGPALLIATAGLLSLGMAFLSGSGMASTQSLFELFAGPAVGLGLDPARVGAVVSLAAAAGRTMSPVSAVTLMCARLTQTEPVQLVRRVAVPLLCATAASVAVGVVLARP